MKFGFAQYWKPTPKKIRKFGDSLLGASTFAAGTWQFYLGNGGNWPTILMVAGIVGKFLSNMFSDETTDPQP